MTECPNDDCNYMFVKSDDYSKHECPECKNIYCVACDVPYHENMRCEQFKAMERDVANAKAADHDKAVRAYGGKKLTKQERLRLRKERAQARKGLDRLAKAEPEPVEFPKSKK